MRDKKAEFLDSFDKEWKRSGPFNAVSMALEELWEKIEELKEVQDGD